MTKNGQVKFAFEAESWDKTVKQHSFNLTKVFRQRDEGIPLFFLSLPDIDMS